MRDHDGWKPGSALGRAETAGSLGAAELPARATALAGVAADAESPPAGLGEGEHAINAIAAVTGERALRIGISDGVSFGRRIWTIEIE